MKWNKTEQAVLAVTAAFLLFLGAYALGRNDRDAVIALSPPVEETERVDGDAAKLDLNTATVEQLMELPNIGKARAEAIVHYREEVGGYKSILQLDSVPGIGETILESLLPHITVS